MAFTILGLLVGLSFAQMTSVGPVKKGGTLSLTLSENPKVMNPILSQDTISRSVEPYLWANLLFEDKETLSALPYLAHKFEVSPDRKNYWFELHPKAVWEDGTPVTTEDVQFTYDTLMNPASESATMRVFWTGIRLEVLDTRRFRFLVSEPNFDTLRTFCLFAPFQKKQFQNEKNFNRAQAIMNPQGNGPYRMVQFLRSQKIEFERKKKWWGSDLLPFRDWYNPDRVILKIISDPGLEYERFLKKELSLINLSLSGAEIYQNRVLGVDREKFGKDFKTTKPYWTAEIENQAARGYFVITLNHRNRLFQSKDVRRALASLVNYDGIIEKIFYGQSVQSTGPFGFKNPLSDPELRLEGQKNRYDPKKTVQILKKDGWEDRDQDGILEKQFGEDRVPFSFTLKVSSNNPVRIRVAQFLKEDFRKAGIEMHIQISEWNSLLAELGSRNFEAAIMGYVGSPSPNPRQLWHSESQGDRSPSSTGYRNSELDALIEKAEKVFNLEERQVLFRKINRILYDETPVIFLFEPRFFVGAFQKSLRSPAWSVKFDPGPSTQLYWLE